MAFSYQTGPVQLPEEFVHVLNAFRTGDPRLVATLKATRDAGWSMSVIGRALGITGNRISQIIAREDTYDGTLPPIPAGPPRGATEYKPTVSSADAAVYEEAIREATEFRAARDEAVERERIAAQKAAKKAAAVALKFELLCQRRFLKPLKDLVDPGREGQRWYRCTKCRKKVLGDAANPRAHRCF